MDDKVTCQICGTYRAKSLIGHLRFSHPEFNAKTYRKIYGPMMTSDVKKKMAASHKDHGLSVKSQRLHALESAEEGTERVTCQICKTYQAENLMQHLRTKHPEIGPEGYANGNMGPLYADSVKSKISAANAGQAKTEEAKKKMSIAHTGKKLSTEHKRKLALIMADRLGDENARTRRMKGAIYDTGYFKMDLGTYYYRSSYERKFLEMVSQDSSVIGLQYEIVAIPYAGFRYYVPDYLVLLADGRKFVVEIKPKRLLTYCTEKFQAARLWCSLQEATFLVFTEAELNSSSSTTSLWETAAATADPSLTSSQTGEGIVKAL